MSSPYRQHVWSAVFVSTRSSSEGDNDLRTWLWIKKNKVVFSSSANVALHNVKPWFTTTGLMIISFHNECETRHMIGALLNSTLQLADCEQPLERALRETRETRAVVRDAREEKQTFLFFRAFPASRLQSRAWCPSTCHLWVPKTLSFKTRQKLSCENELCLH